MFGWCYVPGLGEDVVVVVRSNFRESVECLPDYPISSGGIKNRVRSIYPEELLIHCLQSHVLISTVNWRRH